MILGSILTVLMGESGIDDEHGDSATVPSSWSSELDIMPPLLIVGGLVNEKVVLRRSDEETRLFGALDKEVDVLFALLSEIGGGGGGVLSIMSMRHWSAELGENGERLVLLHAQVAFRLESRIGSLCPAGGGDTLFLRWLDFFGIGRAVFKEILGDDELLSILNEVFATG